MKYLLCTRTIDQLGHRMKKQDYPFEVYMVWISEMRGKEIKEIGAVEKKT